MKAVAYITLRRPHAAREFVGGLLAVLVWTATTVVARANDAPLAEAVAPDRVLVKGPELTLTVADYLQALLGVPPEARSQIERDSTNLREFLRQLYGEQRIAQEAQQLGLLNKPEVQAVLAAARRQVLVNVVIDQFKAGLKLPDFTELAREYYLTHRQEFTQPEQIRVAHILLRAQCPCEDEDGKKRKQAVTLLAELRQGADFATLAAEYSDDRVTAKQGGQMSPWLKRGVLVPPFEEAAFALSEPGALSEVVKTIYGYHLIKLLARQPERVLPFEQVQSRIVEKLAGQYRLYMQKEYESQFLPTMDQFNQTTFDILLKNTSSAHASAEQPNPIVKPTTP